MFFKAKNEAIIKCSCGLLEHQIHLNDIEHMVEIAIIPAPRTLKEKMNLVWKILRGREAVLYDIVINNDDCKQLGDWLNKRGHQKE